MNVSGVAGVEIRELVEPDESEPLLALLADAYGADRFPEQWFRWKHREGPWGPSRVLIAWQDDVPVCTVSFLPWRLVGPDGPLAGMRPVDGATSPALRSRGVFGAVIRAGLDAWRGDHEHGIAFATATPPAQRSHVRNDAVALDPLHHGYGLVIGRAASLEEGPDQLAACSAPDAIDRRVRTAWDGESLRWRYDERSGVQPAVFGLRHADKPTGAVVRSGTVQGLPALVVEHLWGPIDHRAALVRAIARSRRRVLLLAPAGPGAEPAGFRCRFSRSDSKLCVWDHTAPGARSRATSLDGWSLTFADLGGAV